MNEITLHIDGNLHHVNPGKTLLELIEEQGGHIITLCHSNLCGSGKGCMVCAVWDETSGQFHPSCVTLCRPGMKIQSQSAQVIEFRQKVVELLLSEHRGGCESLCNMVCPQALDIPQYLLSLAENTADPNFYFDPVICQACDGKCERACRLGRVDSGISVRAILQQNAVAQEKIPAAAANLPAIYNHQFGKVTPEEIKALPNLGKLNPSLLDQPEPLRCLQCDCSAKDNCTLRDLATRYGAGQGSYKNPAPDFYQVILAGDIIFEPTKCVRCGRCVRLGEMLASGRGPVMAFRGKKTMIAAPFDQGFTSVFVGHEEAFAQECPTGAICLRRKTEPK